MRYSAEHKAETRQRLIDTAGALAKKNGFATTGVDALMASVGLSGAAFYNHFSSKDDLLREIIAKELNSTHERFLGSPHEASMAAVRKMTTRYCHPLHVQHPEQGCPLPSLSSEVARANDSTKQTYETAVKAIQQTLAHTLNNDDAAWATLALNVGAVVMARAMATSDTQQQLLDACKHFADDAYSRLADTPLTAD